MEAPIMIGGGGHARSFLAMAPMALRPTGYVDSADTLPLQRLGGDEAFLADESFKNKPLIITFVAPSSCDMKLRRRIIERYAGRNFVTVIADDAAVSADTVVGRGTAVFRRAVVNSGTFLGNHVVVNTGAIIEHDVSIGDNTFVGPGAVICGGVTIGRDVYIGAGACLRNGITVADGSIVGMGAIVIANIEQPGVYAGNPATKLR